MPAERDLSSDSSAAPTPCQSHGDAASRSSGRWLGQLRGCVAGLVALGTSSFGTGAVGWCQDVEKGLVSGIDQSIISESLRPGVDFYQYSNDGWLATTEIPADRADYGIFAILDDRTQEQVRAIIEGVAEQTDAEPGSAAQKVGDFYRSYVDLDARNAAGIEPLRPLLEEIRVIEDPAGLATTMGRLQRLGVAAPLGAYVSVDARKSDSYTVYVTQYGLTLPDRDYYLLDDERYEKLRGQLVEYIADLLAAADFPTASGRDHTALAKDVLAIETRIAQAQWTKTENRDPEKTYNKLDSDALAELTGAFAWAEFRDAYGIAADQPLVVRQPSYFESLGELFDSFDLASWKAYLAFHLIDGKAGYLSEELERRNFAFHGTAVSGVDEQRPLWQRAVRTTGSVVGELVGQLYVEQHFAPEAKQRMNELVENLKRAFAQRIEELPWMGEGTKRQALEKLAKFNTKIGYPDVWKSYEKLTIGGESLAANMLAAAEFETDRDLQKLGGPIDRNEWFMTPQTINAYYSPTMNEIVFPAAILQPPFFNLEADDAVNYGGIGAVIGHEISHGFDDKGSKFDGNGNLRNWWTEDDRSEFEKRARGLVAQYNAYEPIEGMPINGELTLGENIGDLGGLSVAHAAYRLSLGDQEAPVIDGLSGDQRFFLGWGQIWRRLYRDAELRKRLLTDPHSPSQFRVNGIVRNMDAFYDAFEILPEDPLYLAPENRVRIW
ncbi:MAG: M13 family peptidase [Planctomycetaceae bacterium]|nr:MAG: M13 family peptidase [Planctomycetaceae bacterium]